MEMNMSRRSLSGIAAVAVSLVVTACAPVRINSYAEPDAGFGRYASYDWAPMVERATGDARLDNNPFFHERVVAAVEHQMAIRGYEKVAGGRADLTLHYHLSVSDELDVNAVDRRSGYCGAGDCSAYVYQSGSLVFDLVDSRTNTLVWRSWAENSIDAMMSRQDFMEATIDDLVVRIFRRLPSHS
jgi:hypothetical protein